MIHNVYIDDWKGTRNMEPKSSPKKNTAPKKTGRAKKIVANSYINPILVQLGIDEFQHIVGEKPSKKTLKHFIQTRLSRGLEAHLALEETAGTTLSTTQQASPPRPQQAVEGGGGPKPSAKGA